MTEAPACPGVAEYLYQAASPALVVSDGTAMVPLALSPRCSSREFTPMAGIWTDTGAERLSVGPRTGPIRPAADADGWGALCWGAPAKPMEATPPRTSTAPTSRASGDRGPSRGSAAGRATGGGAYPVSGHET